MNGRRWSDWVTDDGEVSRFDRARMVARAIAPFIVCAAAVALILAAVIVSIGAIKDRDRLSDVVLNSAAAARDAKESAAEAKATGDTNRRLLEEFKPCADGDPPDSPACQRDQRMAAFVDATVGRINEAIAIGLAAHDLNAHLDHEDLRRRLGIAPSPVARVPITVQSVTPPPELAPPAADPPPAEATPTTEPEPTTTTTTCVPYRRERCR